MEYVCVIVYILKYLCPFLDKIGIFTSDFERNVDMKKHLFKSLVAVGLSLVICAMPAFAANTISIADGGISLDVYEDANGTANENYVKVTVTYTATHDETAEEMSRITFALSATEPEEKLAGNEAKVVYLDEMVTPTEDGKYSFVIEKSRIQSALGKATLAEIEGASLLFKMGGVGVEEAATANVLFYTPKNVMYGDVTGDERINTLDITVILRYIAGVVKDAQLTEKQLAAADVNGDDRINTLDITIILRHIAGLVSYEQIEGLH